MAHLLPENSVPEILGGMVDSVFLLLPKIVRPLIPHRNISRAEYEAEIDFLIHNGFMEHPERFFTFPGKGPGHKMIERRPYYDGEYQVISYPSGYEPRNPLLHRRYQAHRRNAKGYIVRWTHGRSGTKTVLCLHGYLLGDPRQAERMFRIGKMFELGLDVALFITPFHWRRAPESRGLRGVFLQPDDVTMTCECIGQAMHDLCAACMVLQDLGGGNIGLIGASLGGYLAGLFICLQQKAEFAALVVPAVNLSKPLGPETVDLPFPADEAFRRKTAQVYELHSPLRFLPRIPRENILIIASRGDRLCPFTYVHRLCERWGNPEHYFLRGGHWLIFDNRLRGRAWYGFLRRMGYLLPGNE